MLPNLTQMTFWQVEVRIVSMILDTTIETPLDWIVHYWDKIYAVDVTRDVSILKCNNIGGGNGQAAITTLLPSLSTHSSVCKCSFPGSNGKLHMVGITVI
jgi:hypothetical protein